MYLFAYSLLYELNIDGVAIPHMQGHLYVTNADYVEMIRVFFQ